MPKLLIFGTGSMAEIIHYNLEKTNKYQIVAFTADRKFVNTDEFLGLPLIPFDLIEHSFPPDGHVMFVAAGYRQLSRERSRKYQEAKDKGYELLTYVDPKAVVGENINIGDNCFVFEGNIIEPFVTIGNDVIVWSGSLIAHHTSIGDHCFLAPRVAISGNVKVGSHCFIGINATIRDGVSVASDCLIGANALILKDTVRGGVYGGCPAKLIRTLDVPQLGPP